MSTTKREQVWNSLKDPEYRRLFAADVGTGLAFQIKLMRDKRKWTQKQLAERTGKAQETISQLENPNYGRYSLNTLERLAGAFDVGLFVKFVPFSELVDWVVDLKEKKLTPPSFGEEEHAEATTTVAPATATNAPQSTALAFKLIHYRR